MNNLTQDKQQAKQAYFDRQQAKMLMILSKRRQNRKKRGYQANRFVSSDRAERSKNLLAKVSTKT